MQQVELFGLRAAAAAKFVGLSKSYWVALDRRGLVPAPIRLGRTVIWMVPDLRSWMAAGMPSRDKWEQIKAKGDTSIVALK